jgi:IMP dehydrogenase
MIEHKILQDQGLTFDDVLLIPQKSNIKREGIDISTFISSEIKLSVPIISSPMDTVTKADMASALGKLGGLGIIHRNMTIEEQVIEVKQAKEKTSIVGAAIGIGKDLAERVKEMISAGADIIVIDSAQGFSEYVIEATRFISSSYKKTGLISGNVATYKGAKALIEAGAKGIRVGMGPGSICTTRIIAGIGVPQITAIMDCFKVCLEYGIPLIADGGIRYSGDIVKALAAGASAVMLGSMLASTKEAPGEEVSINGKKYKSYRGMGSVSAMMEGSAARYGQEYRKGAKRKLVPEGVEGLVPYKGTVEEIIMNLVGGLRSGMYYTGSKNIKDLWENSSFMRITQASLTESHPHDIIQK